MRAVAIGFALALTLGGGLITMMPTAAEAQGWRHRGQLICLVYREYRHQRRSCAVGGYGKAPGDYCECRLWNYGPTVPGVIVER